MADETLENPRPPMPLDEDLPGTCDWGYCDLLAKGWRFAADLNVWLPVCAKHRGTQSKIGRVRL